MKTDGKLMDMLTTYAAAHQHPFNIFVHLLGIPTILLGILIPLTWIDFEIEGFHFYLAQLVLVSLFFFYLTLDVLFAVAFAIGGYFLAMLSIRLGTFAGNTSWIIAAGCFFGGYGAQFIGHAVEKSLPVLVRHPLQANLAAPFFTVVELFKLVGLRSELFDSVQQKIALRRQVDAKS